MNKTIFYLFFFLKCVLAVTCWKKHPSPPAMATLTQHPTLMPARKRCANIPWRTASWLSSCGPTPEPAAWMATTNWETGGPRLNAVRPRQQMHILLWSSHQLSDISLRSLVAPPKAFCMDKICSAHEFSGWKFSGEPACLCRALFAHKYKESNTLGKTSGMGIMQIGLLR